MKVWQVRGSLEKPTLVEADAPRPEPLEREVLIRIDAAGVTPTELSWYPTWHTKSGDPRTAAVPGHEFSGVIAAVGAGVTEFATGQEVFGMNDWFADGATSEYCIALPQAIAKKPPRLSHAEAASVPIGALTAWQGLFDRAHLQRGERLLVHGGAGAVGMFAVQLARVCGAHVIATSSAADLTFVSELGAEQAIDYRGAPFDSQVGSIDVVFDTVGGNTLERSWCLLGPNGRMVTIAASGESTRDERTKKAFFIVAANASQLAEVSEMLEDGRIRAAAGEIVAFSEAGSAYLEPARVRRRGKAVVALTAPRERKGRTL